MVFSTGEFIGSTMDTEMLFVPQIHQAVVAPPTIGLEHSIQCHLAADQALEPPARTVRHNLGVDPATLARKLTVG